jgi:hypothetical protein
MTNPVLSTNPDYVANSYQQPTKRERMAGEETISLQEAVALVRAQLKDAEEVYRQQVAKSSGLNYDVQLKGEIPDFHFTDEAIGDWLTVRSSLIISDDG